MNKNIIPLKIAGIGYSVPDTVITNEDLTKLYDTSDEWIYSRTGIKERHVVKGDENAIDLGVEASKKALKNANIKPEEIDLVIAASSTPPELYPAIACYIQARLGMKNIPAFDITAACSGLIYALSIARGYISSGMYKKILIVTTDNNTKHLDLTDRSTSILFGYGAGAVVVTESDDGIDDIISLDICADGSIGEYIKLTMNGKCCPLVEQCSEKDPFIRMDGRKVYTFVVKILPNFLVELIEKSEIKAEDIDYLILHQANKRIIEAVQERLGYSDEKVICNIEKYGNTSAASIPIALAEGVEIGTVKLPSTALLSGFGAGMTWGGAIVRLREVICG